jgi:hypothetical protein
VKQPQWLGRNGGRRTPATERHAGATRCQDNIAEFGPNAVIRIKFRRDALPQDDLRGAGKGPALHSNSHPSF